MFCEVPLMIEISFLAALSFREYSGMVDRGRGIEQRTQKAKTAVDC
jgi:hypothetical protein